MIHQMLLEQIKTVFLSGGLTGAKIVAHGKRFHVVVDTKAGGQAVLARHSDNKPRLFSDSGTAIRLLHDVGFRHVVVDMTMWESDEPPLTSG